MPRLSDNPPYSIYRVTVRGTNRALTHGCEVRLNVKASSPSAAVHWVLSYPRLCRIPHFTGSLDVVTVYKLRRQPVWLRKSGTDRYRFDVRGVLEYRLTPVEASV